MKIRYSGWWFGADRQRQRLDGSTVKRLVIRRWSVFTARLQIRVTNDTAVISVVEAGDVANLPPGILLIRPAICLTSVSQRSTSAIPMRGQEFGSGGWFFIASLVSHPQEGLVDRRAAVADPISRNE